jgi:regulatory protein
MTDRDESLAPVTYLPGVAAAAPGAHTTARIETPPTTVAFSEAYRAKDDERPGGVVPDPTRDPDTGARGGVEDEPDREATIAAASATLARSLGRRGLSVAEARGKLRAAGLTAEEAADLVDEFIERGWLDDSVLAEQLVHTATTRQDLGTKAVRQVLQKRMLARDVIDAVIAELPDDDAERALEFATSKARSLVRYDDDTAMRRLMGQLARRGFGGSVAGTAARAALAQARSNVPSGGVRFR